MIDWRKCELEDAYAEEEYIVYYFVYPKDLKEGPFDKVDEPIISNCISLTIFRDGYYTLQMALTIEEGDSISDVDWRDLEYGVNYTDDTVVGLLRKVRSV